MTVEAKKILIVDDNALNRNIIQNILNNRYELDTATNGLEAIEAIQKDIYQLILMDIQMPELDGISALRQIREEQLSDAPIMAITAYSSDDDRDYFLVIGFCDLVTKPFRPKNLIEKVTIWLEGKHPSETTLAKSAENKATVLDDQIVNQLSKYGQINMIKQVYEEFIEETAQLISEIEELTHKLDLSKIGEKLHIIKGNAGTIGAMQLMESAEKFEFQVKKEIEKDIRQYLLDLLEKFNYFRSYMSNHSIFKNE